MNTIQVENCKALMIGRRGENEVTEVVFDFAEWATEFGSGVIDLYVKRFGDESAYPVLLTVDGTIATWIVTETDTNISGYGKAEYVYRVDGKIAKSAVFPFFVADDIGQPASEPPDPYESWIEQLTALGAETEANAQAAEQSAANAAQSAEEAAESAASVEGAVEQAEAARDAAQAAQAASEAARDAAQTAQASAESSATAASGSATAAAGSASSASASASSAGASATTASTAATQAEAAKTAAQTAQQAAEQAAQQAHVEYEQLSGEVDDLAEDVAQQKSALTDLSALVDRKAGMLVDTASGAIASFVPDSTIPDLLGVTVDIEPVQDLHGYENPWPAGGGKNLLVLEINALKALNTLGTWEGLEYTFRGITYAVIVDAAGNITGIKATGTNSGSSGSVFYLMKDAAIPAGSYMLGLPSASYTTKQRLRAYINGSYSGVLNSPVSFTFAESASVSYIGINIDSGETANNLMFYPVFCASADYSGAFIPYSNLCPISGWDAVSIWNKPTHDTTLPPTVTIQLGQTVYGGTLTIAEDGSVTALVDMIGVDMGSVNWNKNTVTQGALWRHTFDDMANAVSTIKADILCSLYPTVPQTQRAENTLSANNKNVDVIDSDYSTAADFKAAVTGQTIVYPLATPITIQLDPVTISAIAGQTNNVWADAGDVSVEFAADLKHYIDSKIAAAVAALS